jgi:predicted translin family RNA/ssDNA-binding protein
MERQEAKKKLEEIQKNISKISEKYRGNEYREVEKEQILSDFREAFAESENLKELIEQTHNDMPDKFKILRSWICDYIDGVGSVATLVNNQIKK